MDKICEQENQICDSYKMKIKIDKIVTIINYQNKNLEITPHIETSTRHQIETII